VSFVLSEREYHVREVLRTWREPSKVFFSVSTEEGLTCTLQYNEANDVWRLADGG